MNFDYEKKRKSAFTLAEVLVTLGIIGVVSAMTIPSLTQSWQKKAYVAQLKKSYSEISQAFQSVLNDTNAVNLTEAGVYDANTLRTFTNNYFKKVKDCGGSASGCMAGFYNLISGGNLGGAYGDSCFVTTSGASICMRIGSIQIDVNGQKGPNIVGRDYFQLGYSNDGKLYGSDSGNSYHNQEYCKKHNISDGPLYCITDIINNGWEMKY